MSQTRQPPRTTATPIRTAGPDDVIHMLALEAVFPGDRLSRRALRRLVTSGSAVLRVIDAADSAGSPGSPDSPGISAALVLLTRRNTRLARIYSLAVDPAARGRGLAKTLIADAESIARQRGCDRIALEVRADNTAARALYRSAGFTEAAHKPGYYDDGADGVRLEKLLSKALGPDPA